MKYELTKETKTLAGGTVLHRIRALRDIPRFGVKAGASNLIGETFSTQETGVIEIWEV